METEGFFISMVFGMVSVPPDPRAGCDRLGWSFLARGGVFLRRVSMRDSGETQDPGV